ncbi:unnamed protein product, partial [Heterotrigona itama]
MSFETLQSTRVLALELAKKQRRRRRMTSGMFPSMRHHTAPLSEATPAQIAHVRPLARVRQFVHPERRRSGESLQADRALVRSLARVPPCVKLQSVVGRELVAALGAQERLRVQANVAAKIVLGGEAFPANVALELLRRAPLDTMDHAFVRHQIGLLRVGVAAQLTDERLPVQVAGLVILQLVIRHETLVALVATVTKVTLVNSTMVHPQGEFVDRGEAAQLARVLDAAVDLRVVGHLRGTFERLVADLAFVRAEIAVFDHVAFVISSSVEVQLADGADVSFLPFVVFAVLLPPSDNGLSCSSGGSDDGDFDLDSKISTACSPRTLDLASQSTTPTALQSTT